MTSKWIIKHRHHLLLVDPGNPSRWDCHSDSLPSFQIKDFLNIHHAHCADLVGSAKCFDRKEDILPKVKFRES